MNIVNRIIFVMSFLCIAALSIDAQDIAILKFEENPTNLIARTKPKMDKSGKECAVIRFAVQDDDFKIEGNLGVVATVRQTSMMIVYVPEGTKKLTIRHKGLLPLLDYEIPVKIEKKVTYDATLVITYSGLDAMQARKRANKEHNLYIGAGFNIVSITGPSFAIGFELNHHNLELGFVLGTKKSQDFIFYNTDHTIIESAYRYQPMRAQIRYGYSLPLTDFLSVTPQIGGCFNFFRGKLLDIPVLHYEHMERGLSGSGIAALRVGFSFTNWLKLHITPEYNFILAKNAEVEFLNNENAKFKHWTEGFNLNMGLMVFF